ncbi:MAG: hypothetical protein AAFY71_16835 [Bacteroidota bacterium]
MRLSFLPLFLFCSSLWAQTSSCLESLSPNSDFEILFERESLSDNRTQYTASLIDKIKGDSLVLDTVTRHDLPQPNWFWSPASNYLILEGQLNSQPTIQIWHLGRKVKMKELSGLVGSPRENASTFWDINNQILLYFSPAQAAKNKPLQLFTLDTRRLKENWIRDLPYHTDPIKLPLIKRESDFRKIKVDGVEMTY